MDFATLGSMLLGNYVTQFIADMQNKAAPMVGVMAGYHTVEEDTNFGKLLHKEGLWSLYQFRVEKSLLYHLCRLQYGRYELKNHPVNPTDGVCCMCQEVAPEEIHGLWKLHNFEWIQSSGALV